MPYFLCFADGKTIRELSYAQYVEFLENPHKNDSRLVAIDKTNLTIRKGADYGFLPLAQLKQILEKNTT
jgi:hypothetical protein